MEAAIASLDDSGDVVISPMDALAGMPVVSIDEATAFRVLNGRPLEGEHTDVAEDEFVRIAGLIILGLAIVSLLAGALYRGFNSVVPGLPGAEADSQNVQVLWDWVNLLLILLVLAISALWFNWLMRKP